MASLPLQKKTHYKRRAVIVTWAVYSADDKVLISPDPYSHPPPLRLLP